MKNVFANALSRYREFTVLLLIYTFAGIVLLINTQKGDIELFLNQHHQPFFDVFFKYYTNVGDGWFYAAFAVALLWFKYYYSLVATAAILLKTIVVQTMKLAIYHNYPRPMNYFKEIAYSIHTVPGVEIYYYNSFPSGHTSTAFCMAVVAIFVFAKMNKLSPWLQGAIFLLALLVGISRMYLMQHFFADTWAGTLIGAACAAAVIFAAEKMGWENQQAFWGKSLKG